MAIKALDLGKTTNFISKLDRGDDPTTWVLGTLSSRDKGAIRDSATSFSFSNDDLERVRNKESGKAEGEGEKGTVDTKIEKSKMNFEAVRRGLKGWENFLGTDGNAIPFKMVLRDVGNGVTKNVVPSDLMDQIPLAVIDELAEEILKDDAGDQDGKNLPAPSLAGSYTPTASAEPVD